MTTSTIPILFDKSHLTSIGSRLYSQSLDLLRELIANAYDADATKVNILCDFDRITVEDDGCGMDRKGVEQYFTIGSKYKKEYPVSLKYKRARIGEFGIGKFAVLSLCDRFELYTRTENYAATIIFDKQDFIERDSWEVPIVEHEVKNDHDMGTRVTLYDVKKQVDMLDLERYLTNTFPLTDPKFAIFLNERRLEPKYIAGERIHVDHTLKDCGRIKGEIILATLMLPQEFVGIGVRVKGVLVRRETFGMEQHHSLISRKLTGEVRADFLPITTDRNGFVEDSAEYRALVAHMQKKLQQVVKKLESYSINYQDKKSEKLLSDVLAKLRDSLRKNNDMFGSSDLPLFKKKTAKPLTNPGVTDGIIGTKLLSKDSEKGLKLPMTADEEMKLALQEAVKKLKPKTRRHVKTVLKDEHRIVKKITIGGAELLVSFAHLGNTERESFVDGGIIFINRDHPLFVRVDGKSELTQYHLMRLVSQELIKFAFPKNLDVAFDWQGKLISDAF